MPLTDKDRERVEDTIMDLHFTSSKFVESGKDTHKKLLEINVQEAIEILKDLQDQIQDDEKRYEYKMHMLLPFQIFELICIREEKEKDNAID